MDFGKVESCIDQLLGHPRQELRQALPSQFLKLSVLSLICIRNHELLGEFLKDTTLGGNLARSMFVSLDSFILSLFSYK